MLDRTGNDQTQALSHTSTTYKKEMLEKEEKAN